jgi:hypothetical protein
MARAMEVPIYALFYDGEEPPVALPKLKQNTSEWANSGKDARMLGNFRRLIGRMGESDLNLLLFTAKKMAQKKDAIRKKD